MDLNRQKLKQRLNVRFQPMKIQPSSTKRLNVAGRIKDQFSKDRSKDKQMSLLEGSRQRSITQIRLPSIDRKPQVFRLVSERAQEVTSMIQIKQRVRSIKALPAIKVESKEPINDTITYLMKNEILTLPKIVAMLQKSQSEQFMYMRVKGIYEFEVCNEQSKGSSYITVSKNGMVSDGELIPLEKLIYEYEIYKRLRKIDFFKYYSQMKYMNKWNRGSKKANFNDTKAMLGKLLFLENDKIIGWKIELKSMMMFHEKGGNIGSGWVNKLANQIQQNKEKVSIYLLMISYRQLQKFQLPITESFQLMNKVMGSLINLNLKFENKLRIQRELQTIYKLGRMLQFLQLQSISIFLINHLDALSRKLTQKNTYYVEHTLERILQLDMSKANYVQQKQKILVNSIMTEEISFKVSINEDDEIKLQPSIQTIFGNIKSDIKAFINKIEDIDYRIIRVSNFDFINNNIIKEYDSEYGSGKKETQLREYIYSTASHYQKMNELESIIEEIESTQERKKLFFLPFFSLYKSYREKDNEKAYLEYNYHQISEEMNEVDDGIDLCSSKLHDGEYFILGYLSQLEIKGQIINFLKAYKEKVILTVPNKIRVSKVVFVEQVNSYLQILRMSIRSPDDFIKIYSCCDELEQKMIDYTCDLNEIEKLQDLYLRIKKVESSSLVEEKNILAELKMRVKNYRETKDNSYLLYRREIEVLKMEMVAKIETIVPRDDYYEISARPSQIYGECHRSNQQLTALSKQLKHLNELQGYFDLKTTIIPKLQTLALKFELLEDIWFICKEYESEVEQNRYLNIMKIEPKSLIKKYQAFIRKAEKYNKDPNYFKISQHLLENIQVLLSTLYLIDDLQNPVLRREDYEQITALFEKEYKIGRAVKDYTMRHILEHKIYQLRPLILEINFKSHKEQQIQKMLKQFENWWKNIRLDGQYLDEYPLIIIFNDNDLLRKEIQQYTSILLNIINHKYGTSARKQCNRYLRNINSLAEMLQLAINHQEKFLTLFPILTSKYAEKQLPTQFKKFNGILEKTMKNVKWLIKPTDNLNQNTKSMLNTHIKHFDAISKTLSLFLQRKRVKFQRFYFLQDDQLLEVLVGIGAENTIFRMFEGIKGWLVDKQGIKYGVQGIGNERLVLKGWSYKNLQPEIIFKSFEDAIRTTLNIIVRQILHQYQNELKQLKNLYSGMPWMCVYTVQLILFTKQMEINCFQNAVNISMQVSLIQQNIASSVSNPLQNSNYITLQLFLLHYTEELRHENVTSVFDFKWNSFLRYYYQKDGVIMKALGSEHNWGGEYQGHWNLMINTSDIRRAHTSILSNLKHGNGVLLQGPSGTGKTQSLKQLARCMAKYCVIFNCSNEVNIRTLQKLISGLCYTGSWLCLDQINRLTSEIMSVIATQINTIKNAVFQKKESFSFMGKEMKLKSGVGIFSTMNPIYLKRAKLTENLKSYFRIISVNVPDYQKILQVLLYSLGIASSSKYSQKISSLFKNLSIQLSQRSQYDFGLRAMKFFIYNLSVIRKTVKNQEQSIIEGLNRTFYSRLDGGDKSTFLKVLSDILGKQISAKESNYKIKIMKEAPQTGIIVLGPTSTKTTIIKQYTSSFDQSALHVMIFNPNSIELKYFLGESIMGRWEQGVVEKMARASFENKDKNYVLVLDSKLKSETIQNFNTLLDESKLLSLSNGTRLKIHNNFKLVMETLDLEMTSPATITRCNVIFVNEGDVNKKQLIDSYLPVFSSVQFYHKIFGMLNQFNIVMIHRIARICRLIFDRPFTHGKQLTEGQAIGFEKSLIFSIQLFVGGEKIKSHMNKDNSVSMKKNIFNYYLSFDKYQEGEFLQFDHTVKQIPTINHVYIHTVRDRFYEYLNRKAYDANSYILWKGEKSSGKTAAILSSLEQVFKTKEDVTNMIKITINSESSSSVIASFIEEKINIKKENENDNHKLVVFIDDIHLGNEQVNQFIRFTSEYQQFFSYKSKEIIPLPKHVIVADSSNQYQQEFFSRFSRHFAEINMPPCDQSTVKSIYGGLILSVVRQTRTSSQFKSIFELQVQKIVNFLYEYIKINNFHYHSAFLEKKASEEHLKYFGYCHLLKVITNLSFLHDKICSEPNDLILFLFSEMRSQEIDHMNSEKQKNYLKLAYSEVYRFKYQSEYDRTFKSESGHPSESVKFSSLLTGTIAKIQNWEVYSNSMTEQLKDQYYITEFILLQIVKLLRVLEWNGGNYYLIGNAGVGRKTILRIGSYLSHKEIIQYSPMQQKKIADWYFALLKVSHQRRKQQVVIIPLDLAPNFRLLSFLEKISNHFPIKSLINSENCEFAFNSVSGYEEINYEKFSKSYDEVIRDFTTLSRRNLQFLFYSNEGATKTFVERYHYLQKETVYRWIGEFPSESILQISSQILQQNFTEKVDKQGLIKIFLKIYNDLSGLMKENEANHEYHFKYNPFYHFKVIKRFIDNCKVVMEKAREKEDILNRSILKVHQISDMLERLKVQIKQMEPQVKEKTEKLLQVVPVLQSKKKVSEEVRIFVLSEKSEIEERNKEIEEMMAEVQEKIKKAEPILQEANDSMQTIKRTQLSELRNNSNPHPLIRYTLENMVILLGENESWQNIKKILSDTNLLPKLKSVNPTTFTIQKIKKRVEQNPEWTFQNVSKISHGVRYIVRWINNTVQFYELKHSLDNEKSKVESYKLELKKLEQKLSSKQEELNLKQEQIRLIESEYRFNKNELINLQELIHINNKKYENAELIKDHLHSEINNWYDSLNQYKSLKKNVESTSIFITLYLEVFISLHLEEEERILQQLRENLQKFGFSYDPKFNILEYVKDNVIRKVRPKENPSQKQNVHSLFSLAKLNHDDLSNAKIIQTLYHLHSRPILLDPDNQAMNWLQRQLSGESEYGIKVIITKQSFMSSVKNVELAMREGYILVLLIEQDFDQFTLDILSAPITQASNSRIISYKKNVFPVHENFILLLCNKERNPNISNKLYINYSVLNFEITKNILKNILLKEMMMLENRGIYNNRKQLEDEKKFNEKNIEEMEQMIIESLINSKKTLIDDNQFINLLNWNQQRRQRLKQNEAEWNSKNQKIKKIYDNYEDLSRQVSEIFISLKYMDKINPLLSWNSEIFVQYFVRALTQSISAPLFQEIDEDEEIPIANFKNQNFEFDNYNIGLGNSRPNSALSFVSNASKGIEESKEDFEQSAPFNPQRFENLMGAKDVHVDETQRGSMSVQRQQKIKNKVLQYLKPAFSEDESIIWGLILCLLNESLKNIHMLINLKARRKKIKDYLEAGELTDRIRNFVVKNSDHIDEELVKILNQPNPFTKLADQLSELQILLLGKLITPNNFNNLCQTLIKIKGFSEILKYSETGPVNWFQRSDNIHPILLVMGEDPLSRISDYLSHKRYKNVILIPMGEGQNKLAQIIFEKQSRKENVVIIHNLQISQNFMIYLSKILQQFQIRPPHRNFRLILISQMFQSLNEEITSYCHKYLIQQPQNIKNQIRYLRQYGSHQTKLMLPEQRKMEFVINYLHSIISNLSRFKPFGWNLKYEFHTKDYLNSIVALKQIAEDYLNLEKYECNIDLEEEKEKLNLQEIDYKALRYMIGEIGYIGKLADDIDRVKMTILINQFINPKILTQATELEGMRCIKLNKLDLADIEASIESIPEHDSTVFGLHPEIKPASEISQTILSNLAVAYMEKTVDKSASAQMFSSPILPIYHKFDYINGEINRYNATLQKIMLNEATQSTMHSIKNGLLLSQITPQTKNFNLKSFSNPRQFFISILKDVAHKNNVVYEKVQLVWSLSPKETTIAGFGICNIKLEGGAINPNQMPVVLQDGVEQNDITLYVYGMVKKKEKEAKRMVKIPLYLQSQRQGQINSYGDNTNLLVKVKLQSNHNQQFWILRSTAFIVM